MYRIQKLNKNIKIFFQKIENLLLRKPMKGSLCRQLAYVFHGLPDGVTEWLLIS